MPVRRVRYVDLKVPNRSGQAAQVLATLQDAGVDLLAFTGFPDKGGRSQIDLVTHDLAAVRRLARKHGWKPSPAKRAFLVQGANRVGAVHRHVRKLAERRINVTAVDAVAAGKGQFGMILWVKPKDYARASRALGAR